MQAIRTTSVRLVKPPGIDPQRRNHATFVTFKDPDGNTWLVQEKRTDPGG